MNDGLLIEQVQKFSFLYDKTNIDFKNKQKRRNAWETIAVICEDTVENIDKRRGILRNRYAMEKRKQKCIPSGSEGVRTTWRYFYLLQFLDKYVKARKTSGNFEKEFVRQDLIGLENETQQQEPISEVWDSVKLSTNSDEENNQNSNNISAATSIKLANTSTEMQTNNLEKPGPSTRQELERRNKTPTSSFTSSAQGSQSKTPKRSRNKRENFNNIIDKSFQRVEKLLQKESSSSEDEDNVFARSIIKILKRQKNRKRKAHIKVKIWQVLAEYESDDSD